MLTIYKKITLLAFFTFLPFLSLKADSPAATLAQIKQLLTNAQSQLDEENLSFYLSEIKNALSYGPNHQKQMISQIVNNPYDPIMQSLYSDMVEIINLSENLPYKKTIRACDPYFSAFTNLFIPGGKGFINQTEGLYTIAANFSGFISFAPILTTAFDQFNQPTHAYSQASFDRYIAPIYTQSNNLISEIYYVLNNQVDAAGRLEAPLISNRNMALIFPLRESINNVSGDTLFPAGSPENMLASLMSSALLDYDRNPGDSITIVTSFLTISTAARLLYDITNPYSP